MKKSVAIFAYLLICVCLSGCFGRQIPVTAYSMNNPWECDGNSITVTAATTADSYLSSDGKEYVPEDGGILVVVRCCVSMADSWSISQKTCLQNAARNIPMLCDPISENHKNGEEAMVLLFSIPEAEYTGDVQQYYLDMQISCGSSIRTQLFHFINFKDHES